MSANTNANIFNKYTEKKYTKGQALEFFNGVWIKAIDKTDGIANGYNRVITEGDFNQDSIIGKNFICSQHIKIIKPIKNQWFDYSCKKPLLMSKIIVRCELNGKNYELDGYFCENSCFNIHVSNNNTFNKGFNINHWCYR